MLTVTGGRRNQTTTWLSSDGMTITARNIFPEECREMEPLSARTAGENPSERKGYFISPIMTAISGPRARPTQKWRIRTTMTPFTSRISAAGWEVSGTTESGFWLPMCLRLRRRSRSRQRDSMRWERIPPIRSTWFRIFRMWDRWPAERQWHREQWRIRDIIRYRLTIRLL